MKRLALVLFLGAALAFSPAVAQADTIVMGDLVVISDVASGPYSESAGMGGTFWAKEVGAADADRFMTFCLELSELIVFGPSFLVSGVEDYAEKGGVDFDGQDDNRDYLSAQTKALYDAFRAGGTLPATVTGADLQYAFWFFENEMIGDLTGNPAYDWAVANVGTYKLVGDVKALNLQFNVATNRADAQSLLTWRRLSVPDGGATLMLLGGALLGLGALRRKFRQ